jgi:hypothetical protein
MLHPENKRSVDGFLKGLAAGALGSLIGSGALLYALSKTRFVSFSNGLTTDVSHWFDWATSNLGSSIPVFAILIVAYGVSLGRLRVKLETARPTNEVVQLDHLVDIWTTLFFGTGVIWTAIGMRSALIFALGDPSDMVQQGAFAVLERLVDGGIMLALSTTIFGGIGGYIMRVYKSVSLGTLLQQHYDRAARVDTSNMSNTLDRIEQHLKGTSDSSPEDSRE